MNEEYQKAVISDAKYNLKRLKNGKYDRDCINCIKRKTMLCPNSKKCYETEDKPYFESNNLIEEKLNQLQQEKENLIKYLEDKIKVHQMLMNHSEFEEAQIIELVKQQSYQDILEKVRSGKYD